MNAATLPANTTPMSGGTDFADWLSPILVKELRQGLKSRVFTWSFIVMQVVMIITMGLRLLAQSESGISHNADGFDSFFWAMLWLPLLLIMPARGLRALSDESRANTFDLVQLTRMTAFRIALGKWLALFAQTLLLVAALLPYAVLRYYFGGVDVMNDLVIIAYMLMASMVLTAGAVALSAAPLAVRIIVLVAGAPMTVTGISGFMMMRMFGGRSGGILFSSSTSFGGPGWWLFPCMTALYVFMLLEFAAATFAPPSENHPARKRFMALLLSIILLPAAWLGGELWLASFLAFFVPLISWVAVGALTESTIALPTIYAPFVRRGFLARCLGRIFYPGWATAVPFLALVLGIIALSFELLALRGRPLPLDFQELRLLWPIIFFALISPLPLMAFFPRVKQRFWLYMLMQLLFTLLFTAASIAVESPQVKNLSALNWLAPFPTASLIAMATYEHEASVYFILSKITTCFGLVMLAIMSFYILREFRMISQLERAATDDRPNVKK